MALLLASGSQLAPVGGVRRGVGKWSCGDPHLGNHSLDPIEQSPAEPAVGEGDGELLLRDILEERMTGGSQVATREGILQAPLLLLLPQALPRAAHFPSSFAPTQGLSALGLRLCPSSLHPHQGGASLTCV